LKRRSVLAVVFTFILLATLMLAGCETSADDESVLIVEDEAVSKKEYEYQLVSLMRAYEYYSGEPIDWNKSIEGMPADEFFREQAANSVILYRAVKLNGNRLGLSLTPDEIAQIERIVDEQIELAGGRREFEKQLKASGIDRELYTYILRGPELYYKIYQHLYGENGPMCPNESDILNYYQQSYLNTRHILLFMIDEEGNPLSTTEKDDRRDLMDDIYQLLKDGEDFGVLMERYNEDTAINGTSVSFSRGVMPEDYYQAAVSISPGEFSEVLIVSDSLCIINRLPLDENFLEENFESIREECATDAFNKLLEDWKSELTVKRTALYSKIDVQTLYAERVAQQRISDY
jgi:hypothetical protein